MEWAFEASVKPLDKAARRSTRRKYDPTGLSKVEPKLHHPTKVG